MFGPCLWTHCQTLLAFWIPSNCTKLTFLRLFLDFHNFFIKNLICCQLSFICFEISNFSFSVTVQLSAAMRVEFELSWICFQLIFKLKQACFSFLIFVMFVVVLLTFENSNQIKLVQIGSNLIKLDQT